MNLPPFSGVKKTGSRCRFNEFIEIQLMTYDHLSGNGFHTFCIDHDEVNTISKTGYINGFLCRKICFA